MTLTGTDGTVSLDNINVIPTWVHKYQNKGYKYTIYPIESLDTATEKYPDLASKLTESYNRTKAILEEGLTECQNALNCELTFK